MGKVWAISSIIVRKSPWAAFIWDYELFRVLAPSLTQRTARQPTLLSCIGLENLGLIAPCKPCAKLDESDLDLRPNLDWLANQALLGADLSHGLQSIRDNRARPAVLISTAPNIGNPSFNRELATNA